MSASDPAPAALPPSPSTEEQDALLQAYLAQLQTLYQGMVNALVNHAAEDACVTNYRRGVTIARQAYTLALQNLV